MDMNTAVKSALIRAQKAKEERFVIYEDYEYHVTDDEGLDTFWAGASVIAVADVDGSLYVYH